MEIAELTLVETLNCLEKKQFSYKELNDAYLQRIKQFNPSLNAYLTINRESDKIPISVKDVIVTKGFRTTAGSKILENFIPAYQATAVARLLEKNTSLIGKTNCDEFAMGSSGENSAYGATRNPWNLEKVTGGTSSGSAASVAADLCVFSLGSDTGGSVKQPASLCGVVGLRPTYGLVSRYGLIAYASSLDTIGLLTKCVEDAAIVLSWISGSDGKDSNVQRSFQFNKKKMKAGVAGLTVGVPQEYFKEGLDQRVRSAVENAIRKIESLGARVINISLPHTKYAMAAYYLIATSEASSNLARYDGIRYGKDRSCFGAEVKRRIMLGTFALSVGYYDDFYAKAAKVRTLIKRDFEKAFEKCDVIVGPVSPSVAWNIGEKVDDPLKMYMMDVYTLPASLAGIPGLSIPCGFIDDLPVGLQILGKRFDEDIIFQAGYAYEQATDWRRKKPQL